MVHSNTQHFSRAEVVFDCLYSTVLFRRLLIFTYELHDGILVKKKSCLLLVLNNWESDWLEVASHVLNKSNKMSHQPSVFREKGRGGRVQMCQERSEFYIIIYVYICVYIYRHTHIMLSKGTVF